MSYSIIFQTKIVKLDDNRIIHFDRSGCNNDNAGREKNIFTAKIYPDNEFIRIANEYMKASKPYKESGDFELKIGSRYCSIYDYGKHLLTMLKRAETLEQFKKNYSFQGRLYKGITVIKPFKKFYPCEEYPDIIYDIMYNKGDFKEIDSNELVSYKRMVDFFYDIEQCVEYIEDNKPIEFYIKKMEVN